MLWRLRNLVHHGLADASSAYASHERHFRDSRPAALAAEGGRLFGANAFYVPRGTAFGDEPRPWRDLVRDALVASAMSFPDLARRALGRAIAVAEPEVRASIRSALAGRPAPRRGSAGPGVVGSLPPSSGRLRGRMARARP